MLRVLISPWIQPLQAALDASRACGLRDHAPHTPPENRVLQAFDFQRLPTCQNQVLNYPSTSKIIMTTRNIAENCRKVVCIGRNYAYAPYLTLLLLLLLTRRPQLMPTKRPYQRTQQCPSQKTLLLPEASIFNTCPQFQSGPPAKGYKPAL